MSDPVFNIIDSPDNPHVMVSVDGKVWRIELSREWAGYLLKQLANILAKTN